MEHSSGRSRGTGFVCFWNKEDADKAVKQCELVKRSMGVEVSFCSFYIRLYVKLSIYPT